MEYRDLYDLNRNLTGETIVKGESYAKDKKILVVAIWIENNEGQLLIQRRSLLKNGKWAITGGHIKSGESSFDGILREVNEELGLDISEENIRLINTDTDEFVFCDLYYLKKDININKLHLQEAEVMSVKWASLEEIATLIENDKFMKVHIDKYEQLLNYKSISMKEELIVN